MIIAVDFDGTIQLENKAPNINLIAKLINAQRRGDIVILWTCRNGERLKEALMFSASHGLRFNYVNENAPETVRRFKFNPRKIYADIYIDDKAVRL